MDAVYFSTEFNWTTVQRILSGEKTVAESSREYDAERHPDLEALCRIGRDHRGAGHQDVVPASQRRVEQSDHGLRVGVIAGDRDPCSICPRVGRRISLMSLRNSRAVVRLPPCCPR
jgi:hypothetical protein